MAKAITPQIRIKALWLVHILLQLMGNTETLEMEEETISYIRAILERAKSNTKESDTTSVKTAGSSFLSKMKTSLGA